MAASETFKTTPKETNPANRGMQEPIFLDNFPAKSN
jgi:hypothetical protein